MKDRKEYHKNYSKEWNSKKENKDHLREYRNRIKLSMIDILGGKCIKCGFSDIRALQVDHIDSIGRKDEARNGKGGMYHKQVIKSVLNKENKYQLLCANCNWIKKVENNEVKFGRT